MNRVNKCNLAVCSTVTIQASTEQFYPLFRTRRVCKLRLRRFFRNKQGIDTIIAEVLMILIVVIASVMVYAYATGLFGAIATPQKVATESISLEYASFTSNNTVNLSIRDIGTTPITLKSYYVNDYTGNQYTRANWQGPTFTPTNQTNAIIVISSACAGCTTSGTPFVFQSGYPYTIILVTATNEQFSFMITR
jgi:FlaG/FlaF family flagellin (archaellin)